MDSEPTFAIQAKAWAEKEENITELDSLKRLTASIDIKNERLVTKNILEQQSLIRDRLAKIPGFWPYALSALPAFEKFCCMKNDLDALGHLTDLELVVDWKDPRAFDLVFVSFTTVSCLLFLVPCTIKRAICPRVGRRTQVWGEIRN